MILLSSKCRDGYIKRFLNVISLFSFWWSCDCITYVCSVAYISSGDQSVVNCEVSPDLSEEFGMPLRVLNQIWQILVLRCQRLLTFFSSPQSLKNTVTWFIFLFSTKVRELSSLSSTKPESELVWCILLDTSNIAYWTWYVLQKNIHGIWHSQFPGWHQNALYTVYLWRYFCLSHHCILKLSISAQIGSRQTTQLWVKVIFWFRTWYFCFHAHLMCLLAK